MKCTVLHELNQKYPLKVDYQVTFLKNLIRELEERKIDEIHDLIYEQLASKLDLSKEDFSYKHIIVRDEHPVTVKESTSFIRDGTTGLVLWPAAIALTDFILQNSDEFRNKSILELGSGASSFVGVSLAKHCAPRRVFMSDCHESVIKTLIENVKLNFKDAKTIDDGRTVNIAERITTRDKVELGIVNLPWEDVNSCTEDLLSFQPDILLAADVVYDDTIFDALIGCLREVFKLFRNIEFYLSQTIRNEETFNKFYQLLLQNGFVIENLKVSRKILGYLINEDSESIKILKIKQQSL